jgi:uncharacterized peroxidase-related enzyme
MQANQALLQPQVPTGQEAMVDNLLGAISERIGFVPDGLRLYSISPPLLESYVNNIAYFNGGSALSPQLMAMIRYLVSYRVGCTFCIDLNETFLTAMGADLDRVRATRDDIEQAPLEAREMPLLRLAVKAVSEPDQVNAADLAAAHQHGWSDRDIFDAVVQAANNRAFNLVMRTFKIEHQGTFTA